MTLPAPYFTTADGAHTIYHGEARHILPHLPPATFDAFITDPPYSSGGLMRSWVAWCGIWLDEARQLLKPGGYALMFTDWRMLPSATDAFQCGGLVWRGLVIWDKGAGSRAPHKGYFRHQCEFVVWGTSGECPIATHDGPYPGVIFSPIVHDEKHHVTGKPRNLMCELVRIVPEGPGSIILDPFMGSGTTLWAAKKAGVRAVGIEQEERNCEIAAELLRQGTLF
jgi:site-specific DNA-methyltransferase (adenine-specific)